MRAARTQPALRSASAFATRGRAPRHLEVVDLVQLAEDVGVELGERHEGAVGLAHQPLAVVLLDEAAAALDRVGKVEPVDAAEGVGGYAEDTAQVQRLFCGRIFAAEGALW